MNASIMIHMQDMPAEKCASVKLHVVEVRSCVRRLHEALALTTSGAVSCASQAQTRDALQGAWKQWVEEHGACGACLGCAVCRDAQTSSSRSRVHGAAVAASGSIPAGNTPEVKDWTTRKTRQSKCVLHTALCAACSHRRCSHSRAVDVCSASIRAEIKLTSGKGLADLTVPLSTIIDNVVKQNKASVRPCRSKLAWRAADAHASRMALLTLRPLPGCCVHQGHACCA